MERVLQSAPFRALALSRHEIEGCGDVVLHYRACRRALRHARELAKEVAHLNLPAAFNYHLVRLVEELRCHAERSRPVQESKQPAPAVDIDKISLALGILHAHKGDITAKDVAAKVGMSESALSRNPEWQKARAILKQSGKNFCDTTEDDPPEESE
jgi:AraC-like DNA-binding protein